ncbi:MAG: hypothetical protein RMX96_19500 [Nostoc sp. ChiSLP02]|nr:hypothetical protein [Nostoc sp. DedSLP05]MDZ8097430.1 hypothetical protein [Nostoc sp. DedSLP01]MDZ8187018.1 hypothetical protein [Nostoc sp. ChiSLP02]
MKTWRSFFISSVAISIFSAISTTVPFSPVISQATVIGSQSKPISHPAPDLHLKNSPQNLAQSGLYLAEGNFKFAGRAPIYYSNGQGHYCWYQTPQDYQRLTGGVTPRTQSGKLGDYNAIYDGICTGGSSIPAPHPDPEWTATESSVRFPIKLNSGQKTVGSHWYMETNITVSNNGRIDGVTKTKSCQRQGFTGGVWIALIDKESAQDANILHITPVQHYGINGKDPFGGCKDRTDPWSDTFPADISDRIRGIVIYQHHTPKVRVTKEDVYEAIRLGVEIYKASQTGQ